jgi:beta-barrel assembly-enhancing protease
MYKTIAVSGLLGLLLSVGMGCATNPISGNNEMMFYSVEQDFKIGEKLAPEVEKFLDYPIEDPGLQRYIDRIGQRIAAVCHHPDWEYHFIAVEHASVNALALPGGYVYITRGMLEKLENESQLAAILAHETTHVVARHSMAQMSKQQIMQLATLATLASGEAPPEAGYLALLTSQVMGLSYSREHEKQADLGGLRYMVEAGYDPNGMRDVMEILYKEHPGGKHYEFVSTHPHPENRLTYIDETIQRRYRAAQDPKVGEEAYRKTILDYLASHKKPRIARKKRYSQRDAMLSIRSGSSGDPVRTER